LDRAPTALLGVQELALVDADSHMAQVPHYSEHNHTTLLWSIQLFPAFAILGNQFFTANPVVFQVAINKARKINVVLLFIDQTY
jgi:hypothetical protein